MSVTFKCKRSGQEVTFVTEHDIKTMRQHPEYVELLSDVEGKEVLLKKEQSFPVEEQPKRGRPKKVVEDIDTDSI